MTIVILRSETIVILRSETTKDLSIIEYEKK